MFPRDVGEIERLKDIFTRSIFFLEEKGTAKVPYHLAIPEAVEWVTKEVGQLRNAPDCIPPCGFQIEARRYKCSSCTFDDCQLPIDCPQASADTNSTGSLAINRDVKMPSEATRINSPEIGNSGDSGFQCSSVTGDKYHLPFISVKADFQVEDVHKNEGDVTLLKCEVKFQTPSDKTIEWKFAKDLRTEDLFQFQDLDLVASPSLLIRPTQQSHHGTFVCQMVEEDDVLVRKYFYLNVTEKRLGLEKELQEMFKAVINPPPEAGEDEFEKSKLTLQEMLSGPNALRSKNVILLIVALALSSMAVTMLVMTIYQCATDRKV